MNEAPQPTRRKRDAETKRKALEILGGRCVHCGETDQRCLTIDHKYGAELGRDDNMRGGIALQRAIVSGRADLSELQLLCANCNLRKRIERGEHRGYKRGKP